MCIHWARVRNLNLVARRPELVAALENLDPCVLFPVDDAGRGTSQPTGTRSSRKGFAANTRSCAAD